ncbi:branched-subunit amino acid aminotransferase/4-amino-4-deoxychorismate lyase [Kitasatospora sp. MAP12-15]|uniref:aminotransferase class IV n=1 Tax=unclassified Kitasatospora TaxID=2633591 RepID=UPI002473CAA2|nr:aminotransferase class IV [Kitasatospora sp. MAP12-44]MDH6114874.1 branched-subunit amino acid aminotransferase/4-amino-4-deoxychorismate lyase [Kitasatospora sp. MAP12-44]
MATVNGVPASLDALQTLALTNYGHFTTMLVQDGAVRGLSLHLDRLVRDCRAVFAADLDRERVRAYVRREVAERPGPITVRVTVFDPTLEMLRPGADADPVVLVTTRPAGASVPPPLTAKHFTFGRDHAAVKHVGLYSQLRLRREAQLAGFDDALLVEGDGRIAEGTTWNIGFVDESGTVRWPQADVLPGVTMRLLQDACGHSVSTPVLLGELPAMRIAFATNTSIGVRTVSAVDDVKFPGDEGALDELRALYAGIPAEHL